MTDNADKIVDCDGLDVRCPEYLKAAPWLKEPPLKVRTIDVVKTHPLQCCYCRIEDKTVEAGGIWYCPNPLCSGPGGHWFRCDLDSYALIDIDKHTVNQEEWEARANEYLSARPELYRKVRKL